MQDMENQFVKTAAKCYFMAIAVLMYYFLTEALNLGLFVSYRHAFALLLVASTFLAFLYKPNIARCVSSITSTLMYCIPAFVTVLVSLFIWFVGQVDTEVISRGLSSTFVYTNMLSCALAAVAFLYVFGEKGIWYNLVAILISNLIKILVIIAQNGIGSFFNEFITLIITFADQTGDIIVQAEIHELAFCIGAYLIYMLLKPKKNIVFFILLGLAVFCFLTSFKRIGMIAIVIALGLGWMLNLVAKLKKETARSLVIILSVLLIVILMGYIVIIKLDVFSMLEAAGINTSGRVIVYNAVDKFYEISPDFIGHGIGFLSYQLNTNMSVGVLAVHNDFLQYYIDLGFWGYILWLASMTLVRVGYFGSKGKIDSAIITLALTVYLFIVSSTDNTVNYPLFTTTLAIIMIGHGFDDRVRASEVKMFGCVSEANKETEGESML